MRELKVGEKIQSRFGSEYEIVHVDTRRQLYIVKSTDEDYLNMDISDTHVPGLYRIVNDFFEQGKHYRRIKGWPLGAEYETVWVGVVKGEDGPDRTAFLIRTNTEGIQSAQIKTLKSFETNSDDMSNFEEI